MQHFRDTLGENVFKFKYNNDNRFSNWEELAKTLTNEVVGDNHGKEAPLVDKETEDAIADAITKMKFIPGGRYLYYAGRDAKFYNNCLLLKPEEDTREEWGRYIKRCTDSLMSGAGIGGDYSGLREKGAKLKRTGGEASGPISLIKMVNEVGRYVMQGGSRRSAIYASLNWQHPDAEEFLTVKNWDEIAVGNGQTLWDVKQTDFNFPAPLDMTNISLNYDDAFLKAGPNHPIFVKNVEQALRTAEPGFSFNFGDKVNETLRNACCEVVSEDDSDICNLGSVNMSRITSIAEMREVTNLGTIFLLAGTLRADVPYEKVASVRAKNRRLGLGLMGIHEWLMVKGYDYEKTDELDNWLSVWAYNSDKTASETADKWGISRPVAVRAIAPTGSIAMLAGTTSGIEPLYAVSYKRRYLKNGTEWHYQYAVDSTAQLLIENYGLDPESIESAVDLAPDPERRVKFQADVQDYVDQAISSTINLPAWGTEHNNESLIESYAELFYKYAPRLRGLTVYPDGARGGQPITSVPYSEAVSTQGVEYKENDICEISGKGGTCGA